MKQRDYSEVGLMSAAFLAALVIGAGPVKADFTFGKPVNLGAIVNSPSSDYGACLSVDGLEMYFASERPGGFGAADVWVSTRRSTNDPWGQPANLGAPVNSPYSESYPSLSSDGLALYFSDAYSGTPRSGGLGDGDIWMTTRPSRDASWGPPVNVEAPINSSDLDMSPTISGDGLTLAFTSRNRSGGRGSWDLWMSTRASVHDPWGPPVNFGASGNSGDWEGECGLSWDGRAVFFGSGRTGIVGAVDIWMSTRKTRANSWTVAVNLGPVLNSSSNDGTARVSPDMRTLYFCSDRPGGFGSYDLLDVPIIPLVDFNGDGKVGIEDLVRLIESWRMDDPSVDIGPGPWGDGTVDAVDLEVLMSYWGQAIDDPTLIAHWALDEAEGAVAHDSAGVNDAIVVGGPAWQPAGGKVGGALTFDGVDDSVSAACVLDPGGGPFSIFAWVKGGAPGQVIVSQEDGVNWLRADPAQGCLMTELCASGRSAGPLQSGTLITDGAWHHIGFAWDGARRALYVDDILVAEGTQEGLNNSVGGLYIGRGNNPPAGTFWSGLIDDVRIYNRAVSP